MEDTFLNIISLENGGDVMFDNLQLVPGEAFTASEHIIVKVIDKISNVVGWSVTPKGDKAYQIEAETYFINAIKNNSNFPEPVKAAYISNARKIIREYSNQEHILSSALRFLDNTADPDGVDNDWLSYFFDNAKNISNEEMAIIWGQILAREINMPNQVPKSLIYILSVIDHEDAVSFKKLANISLQIGELFFPIVFMETSDIYTQNGLSMDDIIRLENTNLIQRSEMLYSVIVNPEDDITYFDVDINIQRKERICVGQVILSKAGQALMSVITDRVKMDGFAEFVERTIVKEDGGIFDGVFDEL